ncbi:hypothetical protein ACO22_03092 [Paracoccidioides brasiliensis]|uniref:Uncharacterized protein n=1 Tax=Paracoccidioides brasiliensis TaxID=121759 RepID=A0A1D2JGV3_PARBR|nr:hypothetical protein ACO22_03092 [Paracoccidioides brasiliensis]
MMGDLVICTPRVHDFSLNEKLWDDIHARDIVSGTRLTQITQEIIEGIKFSSTPCDMLTILKKKRVIKSLTESPVAPQMEKALTLLLQEREWEKTLTAEAIAEEDIYKFTEMSLNGRQIKNLVRIAHNVANADGAKLCATHVRTALTANGYTIPSLGALPFDASLYRIYQFILRYCVLN